MATNSDIIKNNLEEFVNNQEQLEKDIQTENRVVIPSPIFLFHPSNPTITDFLKKFLVSIKLLIGLICWFFHFHFHYLISFLEEIYFLTLILLFFCLIKC